LGFSLVGVVSAVIPPGWDRFRDWLEAGFAGEMAYLTGRQDAYRHPSSILPGVRSLVILATDYGTAADHVDRRGHGRVSRYAWNARDYHDVIYDRLANVAERSGLASRARWRGVVDTAPLLERDFAQLAGLGWIGKNTMLIHPRRGSWLFLAALLTDAELISDAPFATDHCGTCRACLDACPTQAFPAPGVLDARRCVSYLTIELRGPIPRELRAGIGNWVFGCDICQDVCPWNNKAPASVDPAFQPSDELRPLELIALFDMTDEDFRSRFRHTPLWRARRHGLLRNAAIALGNARCAEALPALVKGLNDAAPLVRGASAWALEQIGSAEARRALASRWAIESDRHVRDEIDLALKHLPVTGDV
jgi:epoxyqueuosine reductase